MSQQELDRSDDIRDVGIPQYVVHAFTEERYRGNPAAVCLCEVFPDDAIMQKIAAENRLSETAFAEPTDDAGVWALRWFTPKIEVSICGHATLATAFVLFHEVDIDADHLAFLTASGRLTATYERDRVCLDFPAVVGGPCVVPAALREALGCEIEEALVDNERYLLRLADEDAVRAVAPDFNALASIPNYGIIVTAPGERHDFVSRFFAPAVGVPEDPVTGSAHCMLTPYWAQRMGKTAFDAAQLSPRGGSLHCRLEADRVYLTGAAVLHARGEVLPT